MFVHILLDLLRFYLILLVHLIQLLATVGFKIQLKFATVNVSGLNKPLKQRAIFRQLHTRKVSIAFLQLIVSKHKKIFGARSGEARFISIMGASTFKVLQFCLIPNLRLL